MSKPSPTTRSRQLLEREGFIVALVEKRIPGQFVSVDLWNFGDLLACHAGRPGALIVQSTTTAHQADRMAKTLAQPALRTWLAAGNAVEIHGWKKSKVTRRWELTRRPVTLADVERHQQSTALASQAAGKDPHPRKAGHPAEVDDGRLSVQVARGNLVGEWGAEEPVTVPGGLEPSLCPKESDGLIASADRVKGGHC